MTDFKIQIDRNGRILLPIDLRKDYNFNCGDTIVLRNVNNELKLLKYQNIIDEIHDVFTVNQKEDFSMTDYVIKCRRQESEME